jgi:hypothetical protein
VASLKSSHVAYSHDPYNMSHLHNFPCPTKYSHYQSRDMCKIPTLSKFPSKPYEPRDMKGNFGKVPCENHGYMKNERLVLELDIKKYMYGHMTLTLRY